MNPPTSFECNFYLGTFHPFHCRKGKCRCLSRRLSTLVGRLAATSFICMVTEAASSSDVSIPSSSSTTSGTESDVSLPCIGFQGADRTLSVDSSWGSEIALQIVSS